MVEDKFFWIGGALWLDWVNTQAVSGGAIVELAADFTDLTAWLHLAQVVSADERAKMASWNVKQQAKVLREAHQLRADLRELCGAIGEGAEVPDKTLRVLNGHLTRCASVLQLQRAEGGLKGIQSLNLNEALGVLFPIAHSAADWLISADWTLLKKCANPHCILWFYDTSKNHSRRWCSMEGCGNRNKVTAHYQKKKAN